jgi:glycerol-3-phosphate dehydrogenase
VRRDLAQLSDSEFDLVVIGGGIFGACAAWDAAQRGLSVALIDRGDFCSATSANHLKMVHGGIRYLQHGDIYRLRQSSAERRAFLRMAPHLVKPLPIVIPTYGSGMRGKAVLRVGMGIYDFLTADRNRGITDPTRHIPSGSSLGRDEVLRMFPGLPTLGLTGAGVFCDGQMHNPPRLVLGILQSAVQAGARIANYVEATGFVRRGAHVVSLKARDTLTDSDLEIRARVVLNATGPFAERLLDRTLGTRLTPKGVYSRDACFVISRKLLDHGHALAVQGTTRDPDARFSRGARHLFVAPWRDYTLVGVWHVVWENDPDSVVVTDEELTGFIAEVNGACPSLGISLDDVSLWNAGLVPFGQNAPGSKDLRYGRRSRLIDHAGTDGIQNLITLIGVRFTTGRFEAERAIDLVFRKLDRNPQPCRTASTPVFGGGIEQFEIYTQQAVRESYDMVPEEVMRNLVTNYGTQFRQVLRHINENSSLRESISASPIIKAQIVHAVRDEMAQNLADVVFRRTDLATGDYPGREALRECADILAAELGWARPRIEQEIDGAIKRFRPARVQKVDAMNPAVAVCAGNLT